MKRPLTWLLLTVAISLGANVADSAGGNAQDSPLANVPAKEQSRKNPFAGRADAVKAGAKLYRMHCAKCHGEDAQGTQDGPTLRSREVQEAPPGVLFWFLTNGELRSGMPAWSGLPEPRRWQVVSYLQTLEEKKEGAP